MDAPYGTADYYELLQISPHAGTETVHRVYRFLAARYHPDNPEHGNAQMFHQLKAAYEVLSNPERRAEYDVARNKEVANQPPLSASINFMDGLDGELNRRLALLALLYARRRNNPRRPEVSLVEVEKRMGFPRDYLDFTTWYLARKGYLTRSDNSDFTLTVDGVDFVEAQRTKVPVLNKLLTAGQALETDGSVRRRVNVADRRVNQKDRRMGLPDSREVKVERRINKTDRRTGPADRRVAKTDRRANLPDNREVKVNRRARKSKASNGA